MMALARRKMAMAAMMASRIRIVRRVSILCHFNRMAAPKKACTRRSVVPSKTSHDHVQYRARIHLLLQSSAR